LATLVVPVSAAAQVSVIGRFGVLLTGGGEFESDFGIFEVNEDFDDESGPNMDVAIAYRPSDPFRIGGMLHLIFDREVDPDFGSEFDMGASLGILLFGEGEIGETRKGNFSFHANGFLGPILYFSEDDLEDLQDAVDDEHTAVGIGFGIGLGGSYWVSQEVGIRLDMHGMGESVELVEDPRDGDELSASNFSLRLDLGVCWDGD
jgi:hypothetical protein